MALGEFAQAGNDLAVATRIDPKFAGAYYARGVALAETHRSREALWSFERAAKLLPRQPLPQASLAVFLRLEGRTEEALRIWSALLRHHPAWADALYERAACLMQARKQEEAAEAIGALLDVHPDHELGLQLRCEVGRLNGGPRRYGAR